VKEAMTKDEHKKRHITLHECFDELLADFIKSTGAAPLRRPIIDLVDWSYKQTQEPDHEEPQQQQLKSRES